MGNLKDRAQIVGLNVRKQSHDPIEPRVTCLPPLSPEGHAQLLDTVMRATDVMLVLLDPQFNFVWVNPAYAESCRRSPEELIGKNHFGLYPHAENEAIFRRVRDTGETAFYKDKPFVFPDQPQRGVTYWDWSLTPVKDPGGNVTGLVFSLRETTRFHRAEEMRRESEERLRLATKAINDVIWDWDILRDSQQCNEAATAVFGWSEIVEHAQPAAWWLERIHPEDRARVEEGFRGVFESLDRNHWQDEYRLRKSDGTYAFVLDRGYVMRDEQGRAIRMIGAILDLTQRKQAEESLQSLNDTLERRVEERTAEAQRRTIQLQQLAAQMTYIEQRERRRLAQVLHDHLQQLLVAAKLKLGLAGRGAREAKTAAAIQEAMGFVDEAITESRSLTKELSPPILYDAGLAAALEWLGRETESKYQLPVAVHAASEVEPEDVATKVLLFQAVRELLLNAIKHANASLLQVHLSAAGSDRIQVVVEDDGRGFELDTATAGAGAGGFGLFSIRERLGVLGGEMNIASNDGQGARVTILVPGNRIPKALPETPDGEPARPQRKRRSGEMPLSAGGQVRVLLADDHPVLRKGLADMLVERPEVDLIGEACNGRQAVEMALQMHPDVVLMDVTMPCLDGIEATRQIKRAAPDISVIGLSMHDTASMAVAMTKAGASEYLTKTAPSEEVIASILRVCLRR